MKKRIFVIFLALIILIPINLAAENILIGTNGQTLYLNGQALSIPAGNTIKTDEFRGVWLASVYNLDFPSKKGLKAEQLKIEYTNILNNMENLNINSIIFQVRPKGDAFYPSAINPWSEYLIGRQGIGPNWDPLKWMIDETHKRGIEFHAWFNPYRVTTGGTKNLNAGLNQLDNLNFAKKNPQDTFLWEEKIYLQPASPNVKAHIVDTVMEVVRNYPVDGVHFDDYFYPNLPLNKANDFFNWNERVIYENSKKPNMTVADWRRENVTDMVKAVKVEIDQYNTLFNKNVKFGISPFGIWAPKARHIQGSNTPASSLSSYDNQFADTRKWVKEELVHYIAPQLYWSFDTKAAPYGVLVDWWTEQVKGTNVDLYIGQGVYKKSQINAQGPWKNPREISNQLKFNSKYPEIKGSIFYRYNDLLKKPNHNPANNQFIDILRNEHYTNKINRINNNVNE